MEAERERERENTGSQREKMRQGNVTENEPRQ